MNIPEEARRMHLGRSWHGTEIEDKCPCPKEPCGLVALARAEGVCMHHPVQRAMTMRQGHWDVECPGVAE